MVLRGVVGKIDFVLINIIERNMNNIVAHCHFTNNLDRYSKHLQITIDKISNTFSLTC